MSIRWPRWLTSMGEIFGSWEHFTMWRDLERRAKLTGTAKVTREWGPEWCRITTTYTVRTRKPEGDAE